MLAECLFHNNLLYYTHNSYPYRDPVQHRVTLVSRFRVSEVKPTKTARSRAPE